MKDSTEPEGDSRRGLRLRIIATTDLHVHLLPYDYYTDRPEPAKGLAQAASLIRSLRAEMPEGSCLLLDNGDALSGSLLSDLLSARFRLLAPPEDGPDLTHPMIAAMNALDYDAGTLGNHEFDHGLPFLQAALAGATFPMLSANLLRPGGAALVAPWTILDRQVPDRSGALNRVRVGILGLGPPQTARWTTAGLGGALVARDIIETAREQIPLMRQAGADIVVALCHSGIGEEDHEPLMENAAVPLAALDGIDAVVAGHTHLTFPSPDWQGTAAVDPHRGTLHGKPAVQPGFFGSHVGVIDLWLGQGPTGWQVEGHIARTVPVPPDAPPDSAVAASVAPTHRRLLGIARRPVGRTRVPLHSYFSLVGADATMDVVADAQRREATRLLQGRPESALPILCSVSPYKAGGRAGPGNYIDIPPGPLAFRQAADLYVYPNTFCLIEINGQGLRDWLERSAALFLTLTPGLADQPLLDPDVPSYNFDVIDGLSWTLDPSRPPRTDAAGHLRDPNASRVTDLRHAGKPVADDDRFVLATSSYRLGSGGGFKAASEARILQRTPTALRDLVLAHVCAAPVDPAPRPRWRFASLPGTTAWFDSSPRARSHLSGIEGRTVEPAGEGLGGFERFRLRF